MLRGASRAPALEDGGRQPAVGPKGGGAELGSPSAQADGVASDQRGTPRAPARQGRGREPAHDQDDGGAGLRDPLSQAAGSGPALRGNSKAQATEYGRPTGLHDGGAELVCQDLDECMLLLQEIVDIASLPKRSPSETRTSGRAAAKPSKPAVCHMSTQTDQAAGPGGVKPKGARMLPFGLRVVDRPTSVKGVCLRPVRNQEGVTVGCWVMQETDRASRAIEQLAGVQWCSIDLTCFSPNRVCDHCKRSGGRHSLEECPVVVCK